MMFQELKEIYIGKKICEFLLLLKTNKQNIIIFNHVTSTCYTKHLTYSPISRFHLHGFIGKITEIPKMISLLMWEFNKGYKWKQIKCYIKHMYFSIQLTLQITWINPLQICTPPYFYILQRNFGIWVVDIQGHAFLGSKQ